MRQVIKHRDIRLLKMIRRTDPDQPLNQEFVVDCMKKATTEGDDTKEWDFKLERYHRLKAFLEAEHVI